MATERTVLVRLKADVGSFNRGMLEAAAGVNALRKEINTTNDRTAWLTQGILALAPAVVPLGAAAVPVFSGLVTQMTVAGVAAGTVALGFHGIGAALKALNTYQLTPTADNLLKLHQSMQKLSTSGRDFVHFLDNISGVGATLSHTAQAGMFPGITAGLKDLVTLAPEAQRIIRSISEGIGELAHEAGAGLAGPKFREFFNFLEHDAQPILLEMGRTAGHLFSGLAQLLVAFLPESQKFSSGMLDMARSFDEWATGLDKTQGFKDFLAYVDKSGPQALDFVGALVDALVAVVNAAAPVGSVMLPMLTDLLRVFADLADTPLGSTLIALGAAISVYGRGAALASNVTGGFRGGLGMASNQAIKTAFNIKALTGDVITYSRAARDANAATNGMAEKQAAAVVGIKKWGGAAARVGGQAAILGVATSGIADKMHLGNTASLAMAGSLAGPWGAAVGGAIGLVIDFSKAHGDSTVQTDDLTASLNEQTGALTKNSSAIAFNALQQAGVLDAAQSLGLNLNQVRQAALGNSDAMTELNGQLSFYLGQTKPGYSAGGASIIPPEQAAAARKVAAAIGATTGAISKQRQAILLQQQFMGRTSKASLAAANAQHRLAIATSASKQAAAQSAAQWKALGDDVDNNKVSLRQWIAQMQKTADALVNFGRNARTAADRGLKQGLIKELEAAGPAGALRMRQLANASTSEIARANHAWSSFKDATNSAMGNLTAATNRRFTINVDTSQALASLHVMQYAVDQLHGKTIVIRTIGGHVVNSYADGGYTGAGGKYEPAGVVHRGEVVLPQDVVNADWAFLKSRYGYLPGFSEGGLVGMSLGATPQSAGGGSSRLSLDFGDLNVKGTLDTPWGPTAIEGIATRVARREIDADRDYDDRMAAR